MSLIVVAILGIAVFLVLVALRMPIAFAFATAGIGGLIYLVGAHPSLRFLGTVPYGWAASPSLVCLPLFVLMGQFAFHSGISKDLYSTAYKWIGQLPGGLALTTVLASTGFAACTGSSVASAATMGTIAIPEMKRHNYSSRLATGSVAAGGTLGILIPPSVVFIIYGFLTETSIGKLFIAGIFPGLMLSGLFLVLIFLMCKRNPRLGPAINVSVSWRERLASLRGTWGMLLLFILVIGGLYLGVFTPSEAGAIGALGACLIALFRRKLTPRILLRSLTDTVRITSFTLAILIGAMIFSAFLVHTGVTGMLTQWVVSLSVSPYVIVVGILLLYIPLGMLMDALPMILLTMPIVFPVVTGFGFDPIWFGVIVIVMAEMATISPPVGINVYVVQGVSNVPIHEVFWGVAPFIGVQCVGIAILVAFPQISLFLPNVAR